MVETDVDFKDVIYLFFFLLKMDQLEWAYVNKKRKHIFEFMSCVFLRQINQNLIFIEHITTRKRIIYTVCKYQFFFFSFFVLTSFLNINEYSLCGLVSFGNEQKRFCDHLTLGTNIWNKLIRTEFNWKSSGMEVY